MVVLERHNNKSETDKQRPTTTPTPGYYAVSDFVSLPETPLGEAPPSRVVLVRVRIERDRILAGRLEVSNRSSDESTKDDVNGGREVRRVVGERALFVRLQQSFLIAVVAMG